MEDKTSDRLRMNRTARRVRQNSKLIIDGQDLLGYPFTEDALTFDISASGVSFYIKNRPWIEDSLEITIYPAEARDTAYLSGRKRRGKVVRTGVVAEDKVFGTICGAKTSQAPFSSNSPPVPSPLKPSRSGSHGRSPVCAALIDATRANPAVPD